VSAYFESVKIVTDMTTMTTTTTTANTSTTTTTATTVPDNNLAGAGIIAVTAFGSSITGLYYYSRRVIPEITTSSLLMSVSENDIDGTFGEGGIDQQPADANLHMSSSASWVIPTICGISVLVIIILVILACVVYHSRHSRHVSSDIEMTTYEEIPMREDTFTQHDMEGTYVNVESAAVVTFNDPTYVNTSTAV
jgi:hypothetical protein